MGKQGRSRPSWLSALCASVLVGAPALAACPVPAFADSAVLHVASAPTGVDNGQCTAAAPCATLAHALSRVAPGGRIQIAAGWYAGVVTVPPGLTVSIQGAGQDLTIIDGRRSGSVITVDPDAALSLAGVTVTNGSSLVRGGGIDNQGALSLSRSRVVFNWAAGAGGGIFSAHGDLTVVESTIAANQAEDWGGGIFTAGRFTMKASAVLRNTLTHAGRGPNIGGGIYAMRGSAVISDSTIADNQAPSGHGGGIFISHEVFSASHLTITGNVAGSGSGLAAPQSRVRIQGSVFQNNGPNCWLVAGAGSHNLDTDGSCELHEQPITGTDVWLAPLSENGGPTLTRATTETSPARAAIPAASALCDGADQRGVPRRLANPAGCDAGAFQLPSAGPLAVSEDAVDFGVQAVGTTSVRSITLTNVGGDPLSIAKVSVAGDGYKVSPAGCTASVVLALGDSCRLDLRFTADRPGVHPGKLAITTTNTEASGRAGAAAVMLTGRGTAIPVNVAAPTMSGDHVKGRVLVASPGTWVGIDDIGYTYEWLRCSPKNGVCADEPVAVTDTYKLTKDDVGWQITLRVLAKNPAGNAVTASEPGPVVKRS